MLEERVRVVQIMLAKLCKEVPPGYSKSIDKVRTMLQKLDVPDITQFMNDEVMTQVRYLQNTSADEENKQSRIEELT